MNSGDTTTWNWGCSKCKGIEEGDKKRKLRNCDEESNPNVSWPWMPGLRRCPWSVIQNESWVLFSWWQDWKSFDVLPWGGSDLMEQPAIVLQAFRKCESVLQSVEEEARKKQQREMEKQQRDMRRNLKTHRG